MADYKKMYLTLFNSITKAIEELQTAQKVVEEMYINSEEDNIIKLNDNNDLDNKNS